MNEAYLNEYFNYIKAVFLYEYSKYLTEEKINKIKNMNNIFKINNDSKFKIFVSDKINICTNIEDFITENNLNNDRDLRDISIEGKIYVKYLIDNKYNVQKIVMEIVLEHIIKYFIGNCDNVIKIGLVDLIVSDLEKKYNLKNVRPYISKEKNIILKLKEILPIDVLYKSVLNNNETLLKNEYNNYIKNELYGLDYNSLINELNKEYFNYYKRIGKVYYSDTLYDYENIDYSSIISEIEQINEHHNGNINSKINRIMSARESIIELKTHLLIYNIQEQNIINSSLSEIESILSKVNETNFELLYNKNIKIEKTLFPFVQKLWKKEISNPLFYNEDEQYKFIIGDISSNKYIETRLISSEQMDKIPAKIKDYGFIYLPNNIIYLSTKNFLYSIDSNNNIEIDDKSDSIILTPQIIINHNLESNTLTGKILLDSTPPCGVYVLSNCDKNSYDKALVLSDKYELPLVQIKNKKIEVVKEEPIIELKKEQENVTVKKIPLSIRLKKLGQKMIYEEEIEEFKKVI